MTEPTTADRLRAAADEAARTFRAAAAARPDARLAPAATHAPDWLLPFLDRHNQLVMGPHPQCIHLGADPTVIHVAVWAPGFVCCTPCAEAGLLSTRVPAGEEHRCDVCGRNADALMSGWVHSGHAIVHFGVCAGCDPTQPAG